MTEVEDPDAVDPAQARPARLLRPRDQERLRAARGVPHAADARSPSCSTSTAASPGLVTLEDLLEELVGAIDDEHDVPTPADPVVPLGELALRGRRHPPVESLNERLGLHLPTDGDFLTVGGLAFHALGRVPEPGDTFRHDGVEFTVVEVVDHSIRRVRLDLQPRAAVGSSAVTLPAVSVSRIPGRLGSGDDATDSLPFTRPAGSSDHGQRRPSRTSDPPAPLTPGPSAGERRPPDPGRVRAPVRCHARAQKGRADRRDRLYAFSGSRTASQQPAFRLITLAGRYSRRNPGVDGGDNGSIRLDLDNMPSRMSSCSSADARRPGTDQRRRLHRGAPELVAEVASSSVSYDLHDKLQVYRRNGVREYIVWRVEDRAIDWFILREGTYDRLPLGADGCIGARSSRASGSTRRPRFAMISPASRPRRGRAWPRPSTRLRRRRLAVLAPPAAAPT